MMAASLPVYTRIALAVAVGIVLASLIGDLFGAKTETAFNGAIDVSEADAALIAALSTASSGTIEVVVEGARSVYYLEIAGSPLTALNQVTALGVQVERQRFLYDVRAGLGYGDALLKADPALLAVLPRVSANVEEASKYGELYVIREPIEAGQGLAVIVLPADDAYTIEYRGSFEVSGYYRMGFDTAVIAAVIVAMAGLAPYLASRALQNIRIVKS